MAFEKNKTISEAAVWSDLWLTGGNQNKAGVMQLEGNTP